MLSDPSRPFVHQRAGVAFARPQRATLMAHDIGTGKTRTGIMVADDMGARRVLVCCPSLAAGVWRDQFGRWSTSERNVAVARHRPSKLDRLKPGVTILPYEVMSTRPDVVTEIMARHFDLALFDEAHALKTAGSQRTVAAYGPETTGTGGLVSRADKVVLLTGTPLLNHPEELWPHFRALRPELLAHPGRDSFIERYCRVKFDSIGSRLVERVIGTKTGAPLEDLRQRLQPFMHRVRKRDVFPNMPQALWTVVPINVADLTLSEALLAEWRDVESRFNRDIASTVIGDDLLAIAKASPHAATQRRLTGMIKTPVAVTAIATELNEGVEKVVVFAVHRLVINALQEGLSRFRPIVIDGHTPQGARHHLIDLFRNEPDRRVFIGQIDTCSEAIDLTAASNVWIVEQAWTPKTNVQAVGRCDRYGQKETVNARILALEGSIDLPIARINERKARDAYSIIDTPAEDVV